MTVTTTISGYEVGTPSDLDYLIGSLRIHLGDVTSPFAYSDGFLRKALIDAFKSLRIRWQSRYNITSSGNNYIASGIDYNYYSVSRNLEKWTFTSSEPPTIQVEDEYPIILQSSINIKKGVTQGSMNWGWSGGFGSWKDDELSYSNIETSGALKNSLDKDMEDLESILPSRARKLAHSRKQELSGFLGSYEGYQ